MTPGLAPPPLVEPALPVRPVVPARQIWLAGFGRPARPVAPGKPAPGLRPAPNWFAVPPPVPRAQRPRRQRSAAGTRRPGWRQFLRAAVALASCLARSVVPWVMLSIILSSSLHSRSGFLSVSCWPTLFALSLSPGAGVGTFLSESAPALAFDNDSVSVQPRSWGPYVQLSGRLAGFRSKPGLRGSG